MNSKVATIVALATVCFGCAGTVADDASVTDQGEDPVTGAPAIKFGFDTSTGALPTSAQLTFTDYPSSEDAAASSDERTREMARMTGIVAKALGREPLLTDMARQNPKLLNNGLNAWGYWLNARFEKVDAGDTSKALVFSQINRSDDVDTNILFSFDAKSGLKPNTKYKAELKLGLRTNAPVDCFGVGGAPDGVGYRFQVSTTPFSRVLDRGGDWRITNRPVGTTKEPGEMIDARKLAGKLSKLGNNDEFATIGAPKAKACNEFNTFYDVNHVATGTFQTDSSGTLYVDLHTHSAFEGMSVWGLKSFAMTLTKVR